MNLPSLIFEENAQARFFPTYFRPLELMHDFWKAHNGGTKLMAMDALKETLIFQRGLKLFSKDQSITLLGDCMGRFN